MDYMYIVWAVVIAAALLVEYFTTDFTAICFGASGIVSLLLNIIPGFPWQWQVVIFLFITALLIAFVRPICKKFFDKETIPTNMDANIGKSLRLLGDIVDGNSTAKLGDVVWTVVVDGDAKKGDMVEITGTDGNKLLAKPKEKEDNKTDKKGEK